MSGSAILKIAIGVAVAVALFFVAIFLQFILFDMRIGETVRDFPRYPSSQDIIALRPKILEHARAVKIDPAKVQVFLKMERREMGGGVAVGMEKADRWWYLSVRAVYGGKATSEHLKKVESSVAETETEALVAGGVEVNKK